MTVSCDLCGRRRRSRRELGWQAQRTVDLTVRPECVAGIRTEVRWQREDA